MSARNFRLTALDASEDEFHESVCRMLSVLIAPPGVCSRDGVVHFAVEHRNARDALEGAMRKRRGVVAGIMDHWVFWAGHTLALELKARTGRLSKPQIDRRDALIKAGVYVVSCRSLEDVLRVLQQYRVPHREAAVAA